ncbi:hypothetical protein ACGF3J_37170 [Streptomyces sp. NPDC048171]|uniref:hypothetical protein n=1 Tax=Streptomyces sp. NPDC048171 TaxID=3365504 RepID=UPI0037160059
MTTPSSRSPRLLLTAALILAVVGAGMMTWPAPSGPREAAAPARQATTFPSDHPSPWSSSAPPPTRNTPKDAAAPSPAVEPSPSTSAAALPPHGEGAAGDRAIQQALDTAWPADLNAVDERQLITAGRGLLRADATGVGRDRWPTYFGGAEQGVAPAFATARFRIQAAIARQDGALDRAVVHLVWAGTDRGGTHTDGRITDLHFTRTTPTKEGEPAWIPQPGT